MVSFVSFYIDENGWHANGYVQESFMAVGVIALAQLI